MMQFLGLAVLFILGICIGSFLNCIIYRLPHNLSVTGRSLCPACHKHIRWYDNIPLVSFANLRGKCRFCHSPISLLYPVVELLTGILFLVISFKLGVGDIVTLAYHFFIIASLIVIFFTDLRYGVIPDKITYPAIVITFIFLVRQLADPNILISSLFSAVATSLFFFLLNRITRGRGMGLGDVKLAFLMGLFLGFPKIIIALYASFLTGAIVSLILILIGKKRFGQTIPFGPFLVLGTIIALFFNV